MSDTSPKDAVKAVAHILQGDLDALEESRTAGLGLSFRHVFAQPVQNGSGVSVALVPISALSQGRKQALLEAAELCEAEAKSREHRQDNPLPGDDPDSLIQGHKSITAALLAQAIRKLAEE